nr:nicotinate-nucleotide--dimethylbenzimidazole phosphoribosyltransferase [Sutcliffiella rhizosphaerae]
MRSFNIKPVSYIAGDNMGAYLNTLTKPQGSLGIVEEIAVQLSRITGNKIPDITLPGILVFAADHGIATEGVSAYPQEVTAQMVHNFLDGGAAINVLARQINAQLEIVDIGVATDIDRKGLLQRKIRYGTANFLKEDSMSRSEAMQAIETGADIATSMLDKGINCLLLGEMGIGNTTSSSAILSVLSEMDAMHVVGAGTGITEEQQNYKKQVIRQAVVKRQPNSDDAIDVLAKIGGLELAGITGAILAAAERKIPVLIDGFISTVAALIATRLYKEAAEYLFIGHKSAEYGHQYAIKLLKKDPILDLGMRLGEGTGAALAFPILLAATNIVKEMATFESAGVSGKV